MCDRNKSKDQLIGELAALRQQLAEQAALIQELHCALDSSRRLYGLLSICSSCKRIRDDTGFWHEIEAYVQRHSEAEFTHGVCPDCMRRLYPGYKY